MGKVDYSVEVRAPHHDAINSGLSACRQTTMLAIFGKPGPLSEDCSGINNAKLKRSIATLDVGPFQLTGLKLALKSITAIFAEVKVENPELYAQLGTAGGLCCREVRGVDGVWSNHSWGGAFDFKIKGDLDDVGDGRCQLGLLTLYPYFHKAGFYWGAEFGRSNPAREDSMHYEVADQTMWKWYGHLKSKK